MHLKVLAAAAAALVLPCNQAAPVGSSVTVPNIAPLVTVAVEARPAGLVPLAGVWLENVTLDDGSVANVSPPLGATTKRPIVVAVHGASDRPEWACGEWRAVVDSFAFVVCPHGSAFGTAFAWSSIEQLDTRVMSAVAAVRAKYAAYADAGPLVYAGFSQGARLAPYVVRRHADVFPVVALDEGAYAETGGDFGAAWSRAGGTRALLACSTFECDASFVASRASLSRASIDVRVSKLGAFGHTMDSRATTALKEQWKWLVRDDARWKPWLDAS